MHPLLSNVTGLSFVSECACLGKALDRRVLPQSQAHHRISNWLPGETKEPSADRYLVVKIESLYSGSPVRVCQDSLLLCY